MIIKDTPISELVPYEYNARKNDEAVGAVASSIKQFGFKVPIVVDRQGVIIAGHTRLRAAKLLDLQTVPVIVADDLTEEQVRAFRLADNKVAEFSSWDYDKLDRELSQIFDIDMDDFGFHLDDIEDLQFEEELTHQEHKANVAHDVVSILNTEIATFPGAGPFDIPLLEPVTDLPNVDEWISYNYVKSDDEPDHKGVHFFIHDYQFERVWNRPKDYTERLSRYPVVCAPDFSPMGGLPMATQIWNHYRKMWCAAYWQACGMTVIPTITWSTDKASLDWFLDGVPRGGIVITSMMWTHTDEQKQDFAEAWDRVVQEIAPPLVLTYGTPLDCMSSTEIVEIAKYSSKWSV